MAGRLFTLIRKNYKLVLRTRSSALIVIFGPLILIMLVGLAFNTSSIYSIRIGTYAERYDETSESMLKQLESKKFTVTKTDTQDACIQGIKNNIFNVCAVFSPTTNPSKESEMTLYIDNTKVNLVYAVVDAINQAVQAKSKEISSSLVESIKTTVESAQGELEDKSAMATSLKDTSTELKSSIDEASKVLDAIKISFDPKDLPVNAIDNLLESQANSTDSRMVMDRLKAGLMQLKNKVDNVEIAKAKALKQLDTARSGAVSNINYATTLESSFGSLKENLGTTKQTGTSKIISPIVTKIEPIIPEKTSLGYIFPTLLVLIIMFVSMLLASALEIRERSEKIFFKNFITPTSRIMFIGANFITNLTIVLLQMFVLIAAACIFFKDQLIPVISAVALVIVIITSLFLLLGMLFGGIFKSEETSTIATISVCFVMLFFSGTIIPVEALPSFIKNIVSVNPFYIGQTVLNRIMLLNSPLSSISQSIGILLGTTSILFVLVFLSRRFFEKSL